MWAMWVVGILSMQDADTPASDCCVPLGMATGQPLPLSLTPQAQLSGCTDHLHTADPGLPWGLCIRCCCNHPPAPKHSHESSSLLPPLAWLLREAPALAQLLAITSIHSTATEPASAIWFGPVLSRIKTVKKP